MRPTEYLFNVVAALGGVGTIGFVLRPFIRTLCDNWRERRRCKSYLKEEEIEAAGKADVARIKATGEVLRSLDPDRVERLQGRLERVRPPPDELEPPAAS